MTIEAVGAGKFFNDVGRRKAVRGRKRKGCQQSKQWY
jgi:hypothetical protein